MNLRGLLCTALLLAIPAMAQPGAAQAASAQPTPVAEATLPEMHVECTPASRAAELTGEHGCVAGKVFRVTTTKHGDTHLSLCPGRKRGDANCSFHVIARARDSSSIGDLGFLRGKLIAVVGDVTEYHGHPAIIVRDKTQLQVAADEAPQEFDVTQRRPGGKGIPGARSVPGVRQIPGVGNGRAW